MENRIKQRIKNFYYGPLNKLAWTPRNLAVSFLKLFVKNKKIKNINLFEQKFYSQSGEDGILGVIFEKIGAKNKNCVEFGIHADQGNTLYLKKKGWKCLWMDGKGEGKIIKKEFITPENIETIFKKYNVPKEPDLLSIDIDSNDYWVWKAVNNYKPRVVVIEYNSHIPPNESKTIRYEKKFKPNRDSYYGASLLALKKLGDSKGYSLIACNRIGVNAFFIRKDLAQRNFRIKNINEIYMAPKFGKIIRGKRRGYPKSKRKIIEV